LRAQRQRQKPGGDLLARGDDNIIFVVEPIIEAMAGIADTTTASGRPA
jgi:hypothetical protein